MSRSIIYQQFSIIVSIIEFAEADFSFTFFRRRLEIFWDNFLRSLCFRSRKTLFYFPFFFSDVQTSSRSNLIFKLFFTAIVRIWIRKKGKIWLSLWLWVVKWICFLGEKANVSDWKGFAKMLALISVLTVNALRLNEALTAINVPRYAFYAEKKKRRIHEIPFWLIKFLGESSRSNHKRISTFHSAPILQNVICESNKRLNFRLRFNISPSFAGQGNILFYFSFSLKFNPICFIVQWVERPKTCFWVSFLVSTEYI